MKDGVLFVERSNFSQIGESFETWIGVLKAKSLWILGEDIDKDSMGGNTTDCCEFLSEIELCIESEYIKARSSPLILCLRGGKDGTDVRNKLSSANDASCWKHSSEQYTDS